jgi:undecaprenyl phosphate N,N'-diacetylbacillosamine 1-phosphate transferase
MTGLAAVSGRNKLPWERRLDYDVEYVETMSFFGDMKILWRTLVVMTTAHGVFQPDEDQE